MGNFLTNVSSPICRVSGKSSRTLVVYWLRAVRSGLLMMSCPFVPVDDVNVGLGRLAPGNEDAGHGDPEILGAGDRAELGIDRLGGLGGGRPRDADERGLAAEDRQGIRVRPGIGGDEPALPRPL